MKAPYFPFFVKDWLCSNKILNMSGEAVKAYIYLLCASWLEVPRATIPMEDEKICQLARLKIDEWLKVKNEVLQHYKIGTCKEHLGRFYQNFLLEISHKSDNNQRFNNENAKRTRIKHEVNAPAGNGNGIGIDNESCNSPNLDKLKLYDFIFLKQEEIDRLNTEYGKIETDKAIKFLDEYLTNNEKKRKQYKDHNKVLRNWVFSAVKEKEQKTKGTLKMNNQEISPCAAVDTDTDGTECRCYLKLNHSGDHKYRR